MATMTAPHTRVVDEAVPAGLISQARRPGPASLGRVAMVETTALDVVDLWGLDSFPASDPPANW